MGLISGILEFYVLILIVDALLSYFPQARRHIVGQKIKFAADLTCKPIRKVLPGDLPFDISPIIVIVGISVLKALW